MIDAVERVAAWVETFLAQEFVGRTFFDDKLDVSQLLAETARQSIQHARDFLPDLIVFHRR